MDEKSTDALMNILKNSDESYVGEYCTQYLRSCQHSFSAYLDEIIDAKKLKRQDIFQKADLPWKYGYKLLSGETHTKDRDKLLRLFFAMGLTLKEVQRALALYGMPALYPKNSRDAILIIAFNRGVTSVDLVDDWLKEYGERALTRSSDED